MKTITEVPQYTCEKCKYTWIPRQFNSEPRCCPKCQHHIWDKPKKPPQTCSQCGRSWKPRKNKLCPICMARIRSKLYSQQRKKRVEAVNPTEILLDMLFGDSASKYGWVIKSLRDYMQKELSRQEKAVILTRFGFKDGKTHTLEDTSNILHWYVSKERIRQIQTKALRKLRNAIVIASKTISSQISP